MIPFLLCEKVQQDHETAHECHHRLSQGFLLAAKENQKEKNDTLIYQNLLFYICGILAHT